MPSNDVTCLDDHVFSEQKLQFDDLMVQAEHHDALDSALNDWDTISDLLPEEWIYRDLWDEDSLTHPTLDQRLQLLSRIHDEDFWRMT